jgi:hypothetical protein
VEPTHKPNVKRGRPSNEAKEQAKKEADLKGNITVFLVTSFGFISGKCGPHWAMQQKEAESIADPLAKILNKTVLAKIAMENSDYFALAMACMIVFTPKIITQAAINSEKKKNKMEVDEVGRARESKGKVAASRTKPIEPNAGGNAPAPKVEPPSIATQLGELDFPIN